MISKIEKLDALAGEQGATIYNICHRNAGWGVQWYEGANEQASGKPGSRVPDHWRRDLVVYTYYPTIAEMIAGETERLLKNSNRNSVE